MESEWAKRSLICDWIEQNNIDDLYDYILFDCPPATKIVTQNALAASHGYIVPVIPDAVSVRGTPHLTVQMLSKIENQFSTLSQFLQTKGKRITPAYVPRREFVGIVVTKIRTAGGATGYTNDAYQNLTTLKSFYSHGEILEPYIKEGVGVSESMTAGRPVYNYGVNDQNVTRQGFPAKFGQLTRVLKTKIDTI